MGDDDAALRRADAEKHLERLRVLEEEDRRAGVWMWWMAMGGALPVVAALAAGAWWWKDPWCFAGLVWCVAALVIHSRRWGPWGRGGDGGALAERIGAALRRVRGGGG